jgi:hypothetical protein
MMRIGLRLRATFDPDRQLTNSLPVAWKTAFAMAGAMGDQRDFAETFDAEPVHVRVFLLDKRGLHKSQCRG